MLHHLGKGMKYMPGAVFLAATHRGKIKNIQLATLRDTDMSQDPKACNLNFEKETISHDNATRQNSHGIFYTLLIRLIYSMLGLHLDEYSSLGHPYVRDFQSTSQLLWVLCMSSLMSQLLSEADFLEANITYKVSVEFEYLFNAVIFNYKTLRCMLGTTY